MKDDEMVTNEDVKKMREIAKKRREGVATQEELTMFERIRHEAFLEVNEYNVQIKAIFDKVFKT